MLVYGQIKSSARKVKPTRKDPSKQKKSQVKTWTPANNPPPRGSNTWI